MLKLCRVDLSRSREILQKLNLYVKAIADTLHPETILLFGSFAKNDVNEGSDIDVLVVADFQAAFLDRIRTLMDLNEFGIPVEPVGYTRSEFEEMKRTKNPFILEVLRSGRVLYRKP